MPAPVPDISRTDVLWRSVDALLGRTDDVGRLRLHGLGPLAAKRLRQLGRAADPILVHDERAAAVMMLAAPAVLARVRQALGDDDILVFKGPEVASLYRDGARLFGDIDLLVRDARSVQRRLLASGFVEIDDPDRRYVGIHHLVPVHLPGLPLRLEVHRRLKWPAWAPEPPLDELFAASVPSRVTHGISALSPEHHALVLAAHGWTHEPLRCLRDLLDVAVVAETADAAAIAETARSWGFERGWRATHRAVDALFFGGRTPASIRVWGRHLPRVRERMVVENHLQEWLASASVLPFPQAARIGGRAVVADVVPAFDEDWRAKTGRVASALRHPFLPSSEHDRALGPASRRGRGRNVADDA